MQIIELAENMTEAMVDHLVENREATDVEIIDAGVCAGLELAIGSDIGKVVLIGMGVISVAEVRDHVAEYHPEEELPLGDAHHTVRAGNDLDWGDDDDECGGCPVQSNCPAGR